MLRAPNRRAVAARRAGFTLLEVLVVVAILVILAGVASVSIFGQMEKAKVGAAKTSMKAIEKAYYSYYTTHGSWPENISVVASELEQGQAALVDPWGNPFTASVTDVQQPDGTSNQRPVITCQPPGGKPQIQVPEK